VEDSLMVLSNAAWAEPAAAAAAVAEEEACFLELAAAATDPAPALGVAAALKELESERMRETASFRCFSWCWAHNARWIICCKAVRYFSPEETRTAAASLPCGFPTVFKKTVIPLIIAINATISKGSNNFKIHKTFNFCRFIFIKRQKIGSYTYTDNYKKDLVPKQEPQTPTQITMCTTSLIQKINYPRTLCYQLGSQRSGLRRRRFQQWQ
jgi:hypothetical protein